MRENHNVALNLLLANKTGLLFCSGKPEKLALLVCILSLEKKETRNYKKGNNQQEYHIYANITIIMMMSS